MTSGGTESLILACKAYRDYGRKTKGITRPNIVMPVSFFVFVCIFWIIIAPCIQKFYKFSPKLIFSNETPFQKDTCSRLKIDSESQILARFVSWVLCLFRKHNIFLWVWWFWSNLFNFNPPKKKFHKRSDTNIHFSDKIRQVPMLVL